MKLFSTAAAICVALAGVVAAANVHAADCAALAHTVLTDARVVSAEAIAAAPMQVPKIGGSGSMTLAVPGFCRVKGVAAGSIGFEVWLPTEGWNGRFLSVGNGGFGGAEPIGALAEGLQKGFAVTGNDTGHQGQARDWMADRERVRFWGHSATHVVTGPAKALTAAYYGAPPRFAYFDGCSTGGAQAMEEAEYYPGDYDGVVAGAPGMSYAHLMLSFLWGLKATDRPGAVLSLDKLKLLHRAVLETCDDKDGLEDGLLSDPLACRFDPRTLLCKNGDGPDCLTAAQVETARLIYQGPRNPRTGAALYPGFAFGSEADLSSSDAGPFSYGWTAIQGPLAQMFAIPLMRDMVFRDPKWDWRRFDWNKDVAEMDRRVAADITATSPDLTAFQARGGKLLMYQGWGDPLNAQTLPIEYRKQVIGVFTVKRARRAAETTVDGFMRVFMAPGMAHCGGGPGPDRFDALSALQAWVEQGAAPSRIIATTTAGSSHSGTVSRPLCAYPSSARYVGHGDASQALSFECVVARNLRS